MSTFVWVPDFGAKRTVKPRVLTSKFGDGYSQDTPDGINNILETWQLNFTHRTSTVVSAIDSFLSALAGATSFSWTTPRGATYNFKCRQWETDDTIPTDASLSCTFEQVP